MRMILYYFLAQKFAIIKLYFLEKSIKYNFNTYLY